MTVPRRVIYLHGFASSPASRKAQAFVRALGERSIAVNVPDLNEGDFRGLTISRQLRFLDRATVGCAPGSVVLIGSSLGAYTSALFAARSDLVAASVLMAPAFDFARRWANRMGDEPMRRWRSQGEQVVNHYGYGRPEVIGFGLMQDALSHPAYPEVQAPTLVVHGRQDDTVPAAVSETFARDRDNVTLELVDADHTLADRLDWIVVRSLEFLNPWLR